MASKTAFRYIDSEDPSYHSASVDRLITGARIPFDVFIKEAGNIRHLFNKGMVYTSYTGDILRDKGITVFYVNAQDEGNLESYLANPLLYKIREDEDSLLFREYSHEKEQYHQIDSKVLIPGTRINFDLHLLYGFNFSILVEANEKSPATIDETILSSGGDFMIKKTDMPLFNAYLQSLMSKQSEAKLKALAIRENSKLIMEELLENPRSGEAIKRSHDMVNYIVDTVLDSKDAVYDLLDMSKYDFYTYTHSVNVAVMSIGLAGSINLERKEIEKLGLGAMLHDIGKSNVPSEVLNKQGKLTSTEYRIIQNHVVEGEKILRGHRNIPPESLPAVAQHHEKLTGKGYPRGLDNKQISLFGRIAAVADCYDALTTPRPYKPAFTPFYALSILVKEKQDFDCALLKEFIEMLGKVR
ncbi:MAG: HD-GYP domain-containing protein [Nitrospirae bacterium]|nr:MAG: HD-GYP domain-containing protein [Nitrospirota bacterium]